MKGEFFFQKKLFMGGKYFLENLGVILHRGLMITSCQGGGKVSQIHFPVI